MKVLVTGANGLLGSTLCPYLQKCGHMVVRQSRTENADIVVDLTDYPRMEKELEKIYPDTIINLAAMTNVDHCERNPQEAYRANTLIVENLTRWVRKSGSKSHLVHISTDQVYDGPGPHREKDICLTNYYAFSKYAGELAALNANATILRTNFFGVSQCTYRKTLSDWLMDSFRNNIPINIFDDVWFSPLEINSLSSQIGRIIRLKIPGVFNLGAKKGVTKADFASSLAKKTGCSAANAHRQSISDAHLTAYRPRDMRMNVDKYEKAFKSDLPYLNQEIDIAAKMYRHGNF